MIERESKDVDNLLNGKGEWGLNVVPRLQSDKDILGLTSENPDANKVPKGVKGQPKVGRMSQA